MTNGYESKLIDIISKEIFEKSIHGPLDVGENLVGLHTRVEKMNLLRFVESNKVHMIGICGFSGVGKTTIARAIYNLLYNHFEVSSFCEDVKGVAKLHGLVHLQKQLLDDVVTAGDLKIRSVGQGISVIKKRMGSKRVLIVLDDVDDSDQFEALAGMPNWYGPGSMIIVTGKDRQLLSAHGVEEIYEVDLLDDDESIELFSLYAFREKCPNEGFVELSSRVVHYVKGHPLALKILGCFLFRKTIREWESELDKLARSPHAKVQQVLRLSYDGLDPSQKSIFLDIACFFKGEKRAFVTRILDSCELFPDTDIRVLVDKCLITISRDRLQMHDLLQEMGRQVVHEESEDPGRRSRLWSPKDICDVLNKNKGTAAVKGLVLNLTSASVQVSGVTFAGLTNLRLLKLFYELLEMPGNSGLHQNIIQEDSKVGHSRSLEFLSNELRWLCWHGYPFEFLPSTFYPDSLVALNMSFSPIKELWTGSKGRIDPYKCVNLFLPGSSIPAWFINRSMGNRVIVALPLQWCYGKLKGIATCAVFSPKNPMGSKGRLVDVSYKITSLNNAFLCGIGLQTRIFPNEIRCFGSEQVWLSYMVPRLRWEYRWKAAKDYIEVEFDIFGICSEVKECGVRLIYDKDEGQSNSRMIQWLDNSLADNQSATTHYEALIDES